MDKEAGQAILGFDKDDWQKVYELAIKQAGVPETCVGKRTAHVEYKGIAIEVDLDFSPLEGPAPTEFSVEQVTLGYDESNMSLIAKGVEIGV